MELQAERRAVLQLATAALSVSLELIAGGICRVNELLYLVPSSGDQGMAGFRWFRHQTCIWSIGSTIFLKNLRVYIYQP